MGLNCGKSRNLEIGLELWPMWAQNNMGIETRPTCYRGRSLPFQRILLLFLDLLRLPELRTRLARSKSEGETEEPRVTVSGEEGLGNCEQSERARENPPADTSFILFLFLVADLCIDAWVAEELTGRKERIAKDMSYYGFGGHSGPTAPPRASTAFGQSPRPPSPSPPQLLQSLAQVPNFTRPVPVRSPPKYASLSAFCCFQFYCSCGSLAVERIWGSCFSGCSSWFD